MTVALPLTQRLRLHAVHDGLMYVTSGRTLLVGPDRDSLEVRGRIPWPGDGWRLTRRTLQTHAVVRSVLGSFVGTFATLTVHPLGQGDLLATTGRWLLVSHDGGTEWHVRRQLPESSPPFGVLPCGVCHHDGTTYVGEYPLSNDETPKLLSTTDGGRSWEARELEGVRHVHSVQRDPYGGNLWLTTGDADPESRIGYLEDGEFKVVGSGSQRWRAVELAFVPSAVLWGMDCMYADRKHVFKLDRDAIEDGTPDSVHTLDGSVFYATTVRADGTTWVAFSTAAEPGSDSTAPAREDGAGGSDTAGVVVSSSRSRFREWHEVVGYAKRTAVADFLPGNLVPAASAYVYLASTDSGLVLNPFNTARDDGQLRLVKPQSMSSAAVIEDGTEPVSRPSFWNYHSK